ncbi:hypothetical protein GDO78_006586 [Eleutherodactylus coqui]|uniref:DNA-directed RNA polymerase N-terminal domain-containing protein n=1 Tax=Eleutherodactylus coqui TaxID=57060 RepID=A0A8J6FEJ0_ELECQ|nr:hypothetical protein GDO78_006586 [Eleutherodactylus coqui]
MSSGNLHAFRHDGLVEKELMTRVQQLQADKALSLHEAENQKLHPDHTLEKAEEKKKMVQTPKRWLEKLKNEQIAKRQKQKALEAMESSNGEAKQTRGKPPKNSVEKRPSASPNVPKVDKSLLQDKDGNRYGGVQQMLHCYLETCIFLGEVSRAQNCLQYYHQHGARRALLNISMYNLLMRAWAKEASLAKVGRLFVMLDEASLKPNLGSYAAALEAMGRAKCNARAIHRCLKQMEEDGRSAVELFQGLPYVEDEREMVLKAIQRAVPDFLPPPREQVVCSSPLVKTFYSKEPPPSYPKVDFTVCDLQERFEEQLKIESCETLMINSVEAVKPVHEERAKARGVLDNLRSGWQKDLLHAFRESKNHLAKICRHSSRISLYPYLCLLDEQHYVDIMLQTLSKIPPTGESFLLLSQDLGAKIHNKFSIRKQLQESHMDRIRHLYREYSKLLSKEGEISGLLPRELWEHSEDAQFGGPCSPRLHSFWPRSVLVQLGTHLVDLMVQTIKLKNNTFRPRSEAKPIPVLYHMYSFRSARQVCVLLPRTIITGGHLSRPVSKELDRHPERRMKAAFTAYEELNLPRLKEENPNMRLSQLKQLLKKEWMKSPENPMNQRHAVYNAN